ncbi:MAG: ornithine acetyltransferase, partial [Candidatus Latescibacteria bacterium]|nr:ornithine acetyltransferase [Candidatus Latescibacterota bacterium]
VDKENLRRKLSSRDITVDIALGMGRAESTVYTTDMTHEYIKINAEYST